MENKRVAFCYCLTVIILLNCLIQGLDGRAARQKRDDELRSIGLHGLHIIGTRFINEHHEVHDYPGDKKDDDKHDDSDEDDEDYHNPIYDHVNIDKDDYKNFGESEGYGHSDSDD